MLRAVREIAGRRSLPKALRRVWRLWGWGPLLGLLIVALTAQWVWRKWVGLV